MVKGRAGERKNGFGFLPAVSFQFLNALAQLRQ